MRVPRNVTTIWGIVLLGILAMSGCSLVTIEIQPSELDDQMTVACEQTRTAMASTQTVVAETSVAQATPQVTLAAAQTVVAETAVAQATAQVTLAAAQTVVVETAVALATLQASITDTIVCEILYDFEIDKEGWQLSTEEGNEGGLSVFRSAEKASQGQSSLQLNVQFPGGGQWKRSAIMKGLTNTDWSGYKEISFDVYLPEGASYFQIEVYSKSEMWIMTQWPGSGAPVYLSPGQWNSITVPLDRLGDVQAFREIGIMIGTSETLFEGAVYIDRICVRK